MPGCFSMLGTCAGSMVIPPSAGGGGALVALPRSLQELVHRRLEALPQEAWLVAAAASVLGREVELPLLRAMVEQSQEQLFEALRELARRQILEESGAGQLRFSHDKLREVAYVGLNAEMRRTLHRRAAQALEALTERAQMLGSLGMHWEEAGEAERARQKFADHARGGIGCASCRIGHDEPDRVRRIGLRPCDPRHDR